MTAFSPGSIFAERYRIVRPIASGGMGAVYEARHVVTGRPCAIKVMLGHALDKAELRARFLHEARLAAKIRSAHIVDILDAGIEEELDVPFLVMELLEGEDLAQRLLRRGPLAPSEAVTCLWHVAIALDKMHRAGVIHRDLKPRNLFVTRADDRTPLYKVVDFGVAKMLPREGSIDLGTQNVGTPLYMAPEQFQADSRVGAATDIYALGMIAYMVLVGSHYWTDEHRRSENPFAFSRLVSDGPLEPPTARAIGHDVVLPAAFDSWFLRATARSPADRYATATEAITELALALDVAAPLMEPDEVTAPGGGVMHATDVDDPFGENVGTVPGTATGSSKRAVTVRDVDATEASLSVTSSARSTRRGPRRLVVSLSVLAVVATAAAALFVVRRYGDPVPALTDVSGVKQAPPTASPPPATRPPADPPILSPDTLPLEQVAQAADAAAAPPPAPEPAVTPPAPARRPPMRRPPRPVRTAAPDTDSRIRLYGQD